jgi:hypothetical protein
VPVPTAARPTGTHLLFAVTQALPQNIVQNSGTSINPREPTPLPNLHITSHTKTKLLQVGEAQCGCSTQLAESAKMPACRHSICQNLLLLPTCALH